MDVSQHWNKAFMVHFEIWRVTKEDHFLTDNISRYRNIGSIAFEQISDFARNLAHSHTYQHSQPTIRNKKTYSVVSMVIDQQTNILIQKWTINILLQFLISGLSQMSSIWHFLILSNISLKKTGSYLWSLTNFFGWRLLIQINHCT
jgi:hypothetical protein